MRNNNEIMIPDNIYTKDELIELTKKITSILPYDASNCHCKMEVFRDSYEINMIDQTIKLFPGYIKLQFSPTEEKGGCQI